MLGEGKSHTENSFGNLSFPRQKLGRARAQAKGIVVINQACLFHGQCEELVLCQTVPRFCCSHRSHLRSGQKVSETPD